MKKSLLFLIFSFCLTCTFAQKSKFEWGITSGFNFSKIQKYTWDVTDVTLQDPSWRVGYQTSLAFRYRLSQHWAVRSDLAFIQKGWKGQQGNRSGLCGVGATDAILAAFQKAELERLTTIKGNRLDYVSIPLLAEYTFFGQRLYTQIGGYWAYRTGPQLKSDWNYDDWGMRVGIGSHVQLFKHLKLNFETTYIHGLSDVFSVKDYYGYVYESGKGNRTIAVNLGLIFTR